MNRQGNDVGTQYASYIFCSDDQQTDIANKVKADLQLAVENGKVQTYSTKVVTTAVVPYSDFYPAHEEHQEYLAKNPNGYCNHRFRFTSWPTA